MLYLRNNLSSLSVFYMKHTKKYIMTEINKIRNSFLKDF